MSWWCPDCLGYHDPLSDCVMRCDMSRRLDDTDLNALERGAKGELGPMLTAHPVDILRLVEEVRWYQTRVVHLEHDRAILMNTEKHVIPYNDAHEQTPPKLFPDVIGYKKDVVVGPNYETVVTYTEMPSNIPVYGPSPLRENYPLWKGLQAVNGMFPVDPQSLPKNDDGDTPTVVKGN